MHRREFLFHAGALLPALIPLGSRSPLGITSSEFKLAFGSCLLQNQPQPIWRAIGNLSPDAFVFLGDNIYADTEDMALMKSRYNQLAENPDFAAFRRRHPVLATWDDHDYGMNEAGREFAKKHESKEIFLDFFGDLPDSVRRQREGIYCSYMIPSANRKVQILLLDLRWFRSPLNIGENGIYLPNPSTEAALLGEEQWRWLREELQKPADVRIIASSIQFLSSEHRWEKWANFPNEKARMIALLSELAVQNTFFISGDMHLGELSEEITPEGRTIFDLTSSGLNRHESAAAISNSKRRFLYDSGPNFGMIQVNWEQRTVGLQIRDVSGQLLFERQTPLSGGLQLGLGKEALHYQSRGG